MYVNWREERKRKRRNRGTKIENGFVDDDDDDEKIYLNYSSKRERNETIYINMNDELFQDGKTSKIN
jgi:hypothetical protein